MACGVNAPAHQGQLLASLSSLQLIKVLSEAYTENMAPASVTINGYTGKEEVEGFSSRKLNPQDDVHFDPSLAPRRYQIKGASLF